MAEADEPEEDDPTLPRGLRILVFAAVLAVWALAMLVFGVRWWNFDDHGPWLTPLTPLLLGGAVEQALLRRWPEWAREHDLGPGERPGRGAAALGERARPYWAREGAAPLEGADAAELEPGPDRPGPGT